MVKMRILIAIIALALVAMFIPSVALADPEDWRVDLSLTTSPDIGHVPGLGYHFGFGAKDGAVDEYAAADGDEIAPPDPMAGVNAYFYYPANSEYTRNLITSVVAPAASITWPLVVKTVGETGSADITISWPDISSVPGKYIVLELQDTAGTTLADMKSVDHYTFSALQGTAYNFQIKAEVGPDTTPPTVTGKSPMGSDVSVDSDINVTFSEPMNEASAENAFSLVPDVPGSFAWDGNTMTFVAAANLAYDTEYTVTVAGTAQDLAGNGLDGDEDGTAEGSPTDDYSWSFTTEAAVTYYTLTVSCDPPAGGSVALAPEQPAGGYEAGTIVQLTATANEGYAFGSWSGDLTGSINPDAITMDSDKSVTANFVVFSAPGNVDIMGADPGVESINVSSIDLADVDTTNMPEDVEAQEAYVVDSTGTGSFTLRFTNVAGASAIKVYKIDPTSSPPNQWVELEYTTTADTVTFTMSVGDPPIVFAGPLAPPSPAPPMVTTINQWGIVAMITLFAGLLVWMVRRRRSAS